MTAKKESLLAKICTRTSCHGPLDFYQSKGFGRLFWGLVTLGAFVAVGYYGYQTLVQYLQKPTATSISDIKTERLLFPNVTVCNTARYNATWIMEQVYLPPEYLAQLATIPISEHDFKREFVRYLRALSYSVEPFDGEAPQTTRLVKGLVLLYDNMFNTSAHPGTGRSVTKFVKDATFACEKHLVQCKFAQQAFDCCRYVRKAFTDNGYCYTIDFHSITNGTDDMYQTAPGEDFGLDITVQMDLDDVLIQNAVEEVGLRVHVVDYATPLDFNPIGVPPDVHAHIRLQPMHYILSPDVDQCLTEGKPLDPYETYTKSLCEMQCLDKTIWDTLKCTVMASFVERNPAEICTPLTMLKDVFPIMQGMKNESIAKRKAVLNCYQTECPKLCDYWSYSAYVMYSDLAPEIIANATSNTGNNNTVSMKLSVYFADLVYEEYQKQLLTDINTFVSNLGGIVGLWTGISVLSVIQCLAILVFGPCEENGGRCGCGGR